jgi:hypothetical protein
MTDADWEVLKNLNAEIGTYEEKGQWEKLRDLLATQDLRAGGKVPVLAFRRASGACIDARAFLDAVSAGTPRPTKDIKLTAESDHIAIVQCVVTMGEKEYDNFRVFVREDAKKPDWKLLAWANEEKKK